MSLIYPDPFEYIVRTYRVPACVGRRITVYGKPATIVSSRGHHLGINYDTDKPQLVRSAHPVDGVVYTNKIRPPRKVTRGARRYQEYLRSECVETFAEWLGIRRW